MNSKRNLNSIYAPSCWSSEVSISLDHLEKTLEHGQVNLSPSYQTGSVWSREQQELFVGHILQGGEVQPIIFQRIPDASECEVLDGKQRLEALLRWLRGGIAARLNDGTKIFVGDLETRIRANGSTQIVGLSRVTIRGRYINLPFEERKRFYVRLNSAGTLHTKWQLEAALLAQEPAAERSPK